MKRLGLLLLGLGLLSSRLGSAASFEYVSEETRAQLARDFESGHAPALAEIHKKWTCDMYGMRTHLQVKRGIALYDFSTSGEDLNNLGQHTVRSYKIEAGAAVGHQGALIDQIKITPRGKLIAQLHAQSEGSAPLLVAYSTCE